MTVELRTIGDKLAIYTDDEGFSRRLREGLHPLNKIPYFRHGKMVGVDLYFDKKQKGIVARMMRGQLLLDIEF